MAQQRWKHTKCYTSRRCARRDPASLQPTGQCKVDRKRFRSDQYALPSLAESRDHSPELVSLGCLASCFFNSFRLELNLLSSLSTSSAPWQRPFGRAWFSRRIDMEAADSPTVRNLGYHDCGTPAWSYSGRGKPFYRVMFLSLPSCRVMVARTMTAIG